MPTHAEKRILPYTPRQLFDLLADVEQYPDFLPWVTSTKVHDRHKTTAEGSEENFLADVVIGYKMLTYPYHCRVHLVHDQRIDIEYIHGPFKHLNNHWILTPINEKLTELDFYMDFELKTYTLQALLQPVFSEVVRHMIGAFEKRAAEIY